MSLFEPEELSAFAKESSGRIEGKRVYDTIEVEFGSSIVTQQWTGVERSDGFKGTSHSLTIPQAEILLNQLHKQLSFLKDLEANGNVLLKR